MIAFSKALTSSIVSAPVPPVNLTSFAKASVIITPFVLVETISLIVVGVPVPNVNAASPVMFRVFPAPATKINSLALVPLELIVTVSAFEPAVTVEVTVFTLFKFTVNAVDLSFVIVVARATVWFLRVKVSIALPLTAAVPVAIPSKETDFKVSPASPAPSTVFTTEEVLAPPLTVTVVKSSPLIITNPVAAVAFTTLPPVIVVVAAKSTFVVTSVFPFTVAVMLPPVVVVVIFKSVTSLKLFLTASAVVSKVSAPAFVDLISTISIPLIVLSEKSSFLIVPSVTIFNVSIPFPPSIESANVKVLAAVESSTARNKSFLEVPTKSLPLSILAVKIPVPLI